MRRELILIVLICIEISTLQITAQKLTFPLVYKWSKQGKDGKIFYYFFSRFLLH